MANDEPEVCGYARVAHRYQGKYYLSVDLENFNNTEYKRVLKTLLESIPNDPSGFAAWKASRIARLREVDVLCNEADRSSRSRDVIPTDQSEKVKDYYPNARQVRCQSAHYPQVFDRPYPLARSELESLDWHISSRSRFTPYIFELDLDNMCFLLHGYPVFKLQPSMPTPELVHKLHATRRTNSYGHYFSFGVAVPEQYRYDIFRDVPPSPVGTGNAVLSSYTCHTSVGTLSIHELLCVSKTPGTSEASGLAFQCTLIGMFLRFYGPDILRHVILAGAHRILSVEEKRLALALMATALSPSHAYSKESLPRWTDAENVDKADCWWPRKHICVTLTSDLHVERNCASAVNRVVGEILQNESAPAITFGVAFSVLHCVVIRVIKDAVGTISVTRTLPLVFLPDFCGDNPQTPGIEIICRLGYIPASDDVQFFYSLLHNICSAVPSLPAKSTALFETGPAVITTCSIRAPMSDQQQPMSVPVHARKSLLNLPVELILTIASYLSHPCSLNALATTCTALMVTCLPLLRLPQVFDLARIGRSRPGYDAVALLNTAAFVLCEHHSVGAPQTEEDPDVRARLFSCEHWSRYDGREVMVGCGPLGNMQVDWEDPTMPSGPDFPPIKESMRSGTTYMHYGRTPDEMYLEQPENRVGLKFDVWYWPRRLS